VKNFLTLFGLLAPGPGDRVVARGACFRPGYHWTAVPSRHAGSYHDAHPDAHNAFCFLSLLRELAARHPSAAARMREWAREVTCCEERFPHCVVFIEKRGAADGSDDESGRDGRSTGGRS
jgi:hypothetical protein